MPKRINVYLPEDIDKKLEEYSGKEDLKKSATIRKALVTYFNELDEDQKESSDKLSSLESEVDSLANTQKAILKKMGLKVKKEPELKEEMVELEPLDEDEEEDEEEEEDEGFF